MSEVRRRWSRLGPGGGVGWGLGWAWAAPAARAPRRPATTAKARWPRDARVPDVVLVGLDSVDESRGCCSGRARERVVAVQKCCSGGIPDAVELARSAWFKVVTAAGNPTSSLQGGGELIQNRVSVVMCCILYSVSL